MIIYVYFYIYNVTTSAVRPGILKGGRKIKKKIKIPRFPDFSFLSFPALPPIPDTSKRYKTHPPLHRTTRSIVSVECVVPETAYRRRRRRQCRRRVAVESGARPRFFCRVRRDRSERTATDILYIIMIDRTAYFYNIIYTFI